MEQEVETLNKFVVAVSSRGIVVMNPPRGPLTSDDALLLAAWLVALTDDKSLDDFLRVYGAVCNT